MSDALCDSIIDGMKELDILLTSSNAAATFDIHTYKESGEKYDEYKRLERSLTQYSKRVGTLSYIGFVGHFSAGKSSTINSLLSFDNDSKREVGQHPTDIGVTLITDKSNSNSLIGMHRSGELQLGVSLNDNEKLRDIVIADTPGSGDPSIMNEMVRDLRWQNRFVQPS